MGLAAPKNRTKISNDPQNTAWANNTDRFGARILASQGWQPGDALGAKGASHAAHYTAASQSHIRVFLKDDNLGLGAKRGSERAENFGLAGLASILGRLNGNEEAVKKEEERQEEIEKRAFVYRKYGMMNFVSGGLLVGDKIVKKADVKLEPQVKVEIKSEPESDDGKVSKKDKKRKRLEVEGVEERTVDEPTLKRKKKSMDLREEVKKENDRASSKSKKDKKNKKEKSKKSKKSSSSDVEAITSTSATPTSDPEPFTDKARRKAEKKARKQERKLKKALKKAAKEAAKANGDVDESSSDSDEDETTAASSTTTSVPATGASTPSGLAYTPRGMHAVRQRWIRQKKAATMDAQAMKEIFMIKTPS